MVKTFALVEDSVAPAAQTALEYSLFFPVCIKARACRTDQCAVGGSAANIAVDRTAYCTDTGANACAFRDAFADDDFLTVAFAVFPICRE